jgi:hypothetical protein
MTKRRYEILLPTRHNDGRSLLVRETHRLEQTLRETVERFGAMSYSPNAILGVWRNAEGQMYDDNLFSLTIDVDDTAANREYFVQLKHVLAERFEQEEVYIATYAVELL